MKNPHLKWKKRHWALIDAVDKHHRHSGIQWIQWVSFPFFNNTVQHPRKTLGSMSTMQCTDSFSFNLLVLALHIDISPRHCLFSSLTSTRWQCTAYPHYKLLRLLSVRTLPQYPCTRSGWHAASFWVLWQSFDPEFGLSVALPSSFFFYVGCGMDFAPFCVVLHSHVHFFHAPLLQSVFIMTGLPVSCCVCLINAKGGRSNINRLNSSGVLWPFSLGWSLHPQSKRKLKSRFKKSGPCHPLIPPFN